MTSRYVLGIDSGTTVVKAVLFDTEGNEVHSAHRDMPLQHPFTDAVEIDMDTAWQLTAEAVREVVQKTDPKQILAVGIAGTACGFWGVDASNRPVRPAILWNDGRAGTIITDWQADGFYPEIFQRTGNAPFPGYPLSLVCWLKTHEPETLDRTRWLLFQKDWLRYRLTGDIHTDLSDMSYFPGDLENRAYDTTLLDRVGLSQLVDKLPPIRETTDVTGYVHAEAASETGLAEGTPVVAGAVDVVASVLGGGAAQLGQACSILGTSFLNSWIAEAPGYDPPDTGVQACMPGGTYVRSLVNTSGTLCINWMNNALVDSTVMGIEDSGERFAEIEKQVLSSPPGANGLIFLPYLNTAGIISPFADPNARGMFFGLSANHTRADMLRAVYEGTAFAMRDCFEASGRRPDSVVLVGGGARSAFWSQLFADMNGSEIIVPLGTEFGARGVAAAAAVGAGIFDDLPQALSQMVRPAHQYTPNPKYTAVYDELYPLYRHLYQSVRSAWTLRADILRQLPALQKE